MSESRDDAQTKTRGTLLVVDGHSLAFRAFFALPAENFSTQAGQATNAVWGFATMLSQVLDSEKPDHLAVAFDMKGGTFTISNGGVFGSMLSTPIINPPQSAILGIHATKDRPVVENGEIVIRPINYLAMSYDHRIIDGREAVLALVTMKEALEDPARLLLGV